MARFPTFLSSPTPLGVDFAARQAVSSRHFLFRVPLPSLALLIAGLAVAATCAVEVVAVEDRARAAADRVDALRRSMARSARRPSDAAASGGPSFGRPAGPAADRAAGSAAALGRAAGPDAVRTAQKIASAVAEPWDAVFDELEAAAGKGVGLLTLDAEAASRTIRLSAEAASAADAFAYVERLSASARFNDVSIVSHEERQAGATSVFFFAVVIAWSPAR